MSGKVKIAIVAPACRLVPETAARVTAFAAAQFPAATLHIHPQCYFSAGHFAGEDSARAAAFVEVANDPGFDAVWFARGGYGSARMAALAIPQLGAAARRKTYLGYSDLSALLAGLYAKGFPDLAHGPMPSDISRKDGEAAVARALAWLTTRAADSLEPSLPALWAGGGKAAAFNLMTFSQVIGTPLQPNLAGHVLMVEEVSEHMYRIDRSLMHLTENRALRKLAGIKLGRCSAIPENDPPFVLDEEQVVRHWCGVSGIPYLGRADIGHDAANKIVPFGAKPVSV